MNRGVRQDIPIALEGFEERGLIYRVRGIFRSGQLIIDGQPLHRRRRQYLLRDNQGREVAVRLKRNLVDPIPKLQVEGRVLDLLPPLKWYEYLWAGLPLLLVVAGGAIGAAIGSAALYYNVRLFRGDQSGARRYLDAGATTIGAAIAYVVVVSPLIGAAGWLRAAYSPPPHFVATDWVRRTIHGISFDAPVDFDARPDIVGRLPQSVRDVTDSVEMYSSRGRSDNFTIGVSCTTYKSGVRINLDGGVAGAMKMAGAAVGDSDPQYAASPTTLDGLEARTASYQHTVWGRTLHVEALLVERAQTVWQVQVSYFNDVSATDAARILHSVSIAP